MLSSFFKSRSEDNCFSRQRLVAEKIDCPNKNQATSDKTVPSIANQNTVVIDHIPWPAR